MTGLSGADAVKLRKIVGLFDSPVDTEAAAAFSFAYAMCGRLGVRVVDALAEVVAPAPAPMTPRPVDVGTPWRRKVMMCRDAAHLYDVRARDFLASMNELRGTPSRKQLAYLSSLYARAVRHFDGMAE